MCNFSLYGIVIICPNTFHLLIVRTLSLDVYGIYFSFGCFDLDVKLHLLIIFGELYGISVAS